MNTRTLSIFFTLILFSFQCYAAEPTKEDKKKFKKVKKLYQKHDFSIRFIFGGPEIDPDFASSLKNALPFLEFTSIEPMMTAIGEDCEPCRDLKNFFMATSTNKVFYLTKSGRDLSCKISSAVNCVDEAQLQQEIVDEIIRRKNKQKDVIIYIPGIDAQKLKSLVAEGWSQIEPKDKSAYDIEHATDCVGKEVNLYKLKPCVATDEFKMVWKDESAWSKCEYENNCINLYPPANKKNYYFYTNEICAENFRLDFIKDGASAWSLLFALDEVITDKGYYEFQIPHQGKEEGDENGVNEKLSYYIDYELVLAIIEEDNVSDEIRLGDFVFIKCQK